ncbi:hypothetical protein MKK75_29950 [Methylobacterium sp. J-030]|uniref:hypothetical protein n=1 Tax=Methylobacterium sp. J-030 TaxID=2836627 RepID=UPI001FBB7547|nr:hypothetical protein [Methylobacterium sp. J-030]MCJ2072969.1 hypothetical protein [Methylobacterium sp. J-030]
MAQWIREQGFENERIAPAHGLRHWWKSTASRLGIPDSIADAVQGDAATGAAATYRHIDVGQMNEAITRFSVPSLTKDDDGAVEVRVLTAAVADDKPRRRRTITFAP